MPSASGVTPTGGSWLTKVGAKNVSVALEVTIGEQRVDESTDECLVVFDAHAGIVSKRRGERYPNIVGCYAASEPPGMTARNRSIIGFTCSGTSSCRK